MDDLTAIVRSWFHDPYEGMGYRAEKRRWGTYWSHRQVYVAELPLEQVPAFLDDVCTYYSNGGVPEVKVYLNLESREVEARLGPALLAVGCAPGTTEMFLAHTGTLPDCVAVSGLAVEPVNAANLDLFVATKRRIFSADDAVPNAARRVEEIAQRRGELTGNARGLLARVDGEPAGIVWWYAEIETDWVVLLGVRAPFRRRGIARWLLGQRLAEVERQGTSLFINVLADNARAIRLYCYLGFTNEVYWRRRYVLSF